MDMSTECVRVGPSKKILDWKPPFTQSRGRPPEEWEKQVKKDMLRRDIADHDWRNREAWRRGCERWPREL
nr:unnamed protein product [Callosobruchus chinensis]CAH7754322.1 unnamed protein product [Callosobruchus chinensis]